jgi:hypothetical protein
MPDSNDLKSLDSQLKKTLISAESFKKGSSVDVSKSILKIQKTFTSLIDSVRQLVTSVVSIKKIVDNNSLKINSLKNISKIQKIRITGESIGSKLLVPPTVKGVTPPVPPTVKGVTPPVPPTVKGVTPPVPPAVKGVTPPVTPAVIGTPPVTPAVKGVTPPVTPTVKGVTPPVTPVSGSIPKLIDDLKKLNIKVIDIEKIVNNNSRKITSLKNISKTQSTRISGENIGAKLPGSSSSNVEDSITKIAASVASIAAILAGRQKALNNAAAFDRRKAEQEKRGVAEGNLEKKFEGLKSEAEKVISPVKSILDRIIDFFVTVFLGRVVYKLLEWFGDPKNADKVKAIGRFLGDHWPKLLALYLVFGNAFGRFALSLTKVVAKGAVGLLAKILLLSKAQKLRGLGRFLGGRGGKVLAGAVATTAVVTGGLALSEGLKGSDEPKSEPEVQGYSGGGFVMPKFPAFKGGGFNFKGMLGGMGDMFGGFVSGEKGVDKIPAMLSDGEFVMSAGAVQKYGVDTLEGMNAAGGGTNKPKMMGGTTYAAGGGMIGDEREKVRDRILEKREKTFGPGATPTMSSQADMNKLADKITLEQRLKRIESQMQVQKALASGKGVNIRGASAGAQLGTGYGATYQGKKSIVIKGGAKNFSTGIGDKEITLAGQRYFAMKKGDDVIYTPQDKRDIGGGGMFQPGGMFGGPRMSARGDYAASKGKYYSSSDQKTYGSENDALAARKSRMTSLASQQKLDRGGGGFLQPGGLFGGPRMSARVGYAASKGKYYSSSDQKTYANENDAKAARQSRMTSLASQQRLNKLSFAGANRSSRGVRIDAQDKERGEEFKERGGLMGQFGRLGQRMFGGAEAQKKLDMQQKASDARVKQAGASSIGRYYSSSDGKYYANFAAADKARIARQRQVNPPVKPKPKVVYSPAGGRQEANRKRSTGTGTPKFSASNPNAHRSKQETLGLMR